ncbi:MAG: V-type ATPase subunit, partial [Clostridia bacterium]|nr:V-type ATPase subunit [Clostridia bacterium]
MISNVTKYSGSYAKICAMKSKLLKESDYKRLAGFSCVKEIALYLKETSRYKAVFENADIDNMDRLDFQELICHSGDDDLISLRRFIGADGKELLTLFVMEKEVAFLKQILRSIESESKYQPTFDDGGILRKYFSFDVNSIADSATVAELADKLQDSKYYSQLSKFVQDPGFYNLFNMEMALDTYYYKYAWNTG